MDKALKLAALLVMFWNLENFFYPSKGDNLMENPRAVTWKHFKAKRDLISKTIIAVKDKEGQYPAIIGLCEVENAKTLKISSMTLRFQGSATRSFTKILRTKEA